MSDQQTTEIAPSPVPATPSKPDPTAMLNALQPFAPLMEEAVEAYKTGQKGNTLASSVLLFCIVGALSFLAAMAMYLNHVDTAEKIIIGLLSFLGGTAIFGGGAKK